MLKFMGISYTDFTPEGKTAADAIKGYRAHFADENCIVPDKGVGGEVFSTWLTPDRAAMLGINSPADMQMLAAHVGKPVMIAWSRKGDNKIDGWDIKLHADFPPENAQTSIPAAKKLGA